MELKAGHPLTVALVVLTATTGVIEAVSLLALGHVFTAMMTGNLLFLAFGLAGAHELSVAASSVSLGAFAAGVVTGTLLERWVDARQQRWFLAGLLTEAVLLTAGGLTATGLGGPGTPLTGRHYAVIAVVALAMGLRSLTTLRAHVTDLPTTLATRTLTALLTGLPAHHLPARRAAAVLAIFTGGLLGAVALEAGRRPSTLLLLAAALVLATAVAHAAARGGTAA
ncbi:YoaK family protein [Kitasatospora sp. NPDC054939]